MKEKSAIFFNYVKKYKILLMASCLSAFVVIGCVLFFTQSKNSKIYAVAGNQIEELSQNIIKSYRLSPNYWGLSTNEVINKKLYANGMGIKDNKLIGYFNNVVEVGADENGNPVRPGEKNFVITYSGLNKKQCVGLGSYKYSDQFWLNVSKITVKNSETTQDFLWGYEEYGLIPSVKALKNICNGSDNKILVYF